VVGSNGSMTPEARSTRNRNVVDRFPYGVVGWAPEEVRGMAQSRGYDLSLEDATNLLLGSERLLKGSMECAGRDFIRSLISEKFKASSPDSENLAEPKT
jgi:hypothetical protein